MDENDMSDGFPNNMDEPSLGETGAQMKRAVSELAAARIELAALEAREALQFGIRKGVIAGALGASAFFAWALTMAALTGLLAPQLDKWQQKPEWLPAWAGIALTLAILHALIALTLYLKLRKKPDTEFFELSKQEIENDKQWLKKKI